MKILYLCNVPIKIIADDIKVNNRFGGWLDGAISKILDNKENNILYLFPNKILKNNKLGNLEYESFKCDNIYKKDNKLIAYFEDKIEKFKPDIIHIWGTEFSHSLCMAYACRNKGLTNRTILNIQGLCTTINKSYYADLPSNVIHKFNLRGILKGFKNIKSDKNAFKVRGKNESEILSIVKNVVGRTDFVKAVVYQTNKDINYYHCYETLRNTFYNGNWDYNKCEKHSIFLSQGSYPIKGFHKLIEALKILIKKYPDTKVYTTGKSLLNLSFVERLKLNTYQQYIIKLIKKYKLQNNIKFLGGLNEEEMKQAYLKSNCAVTCSSVESSSNSMGEAMILGVPSVVSFVGGLPSLFAHNVDGFMYPFDAEYMLAYYIEQIFENESLAENFSKNARVHALKIWDRDKNYKDLVGIYQKVMN